MASKAKQAAEKVVDRMISDQNRRDRAASKAKRNRASTTTFYVPRGWTYAETLLATKQQLEEQLRIVNLAIAVEHQGHLVREITSQKKKRRKNENQG